MGEQVPRLLPGSGEVRPSRSTVWTVTVKLNALLLILGSLVFGVGLVLGLVPMSQSGSNCGSAFIPNAYSIHQSLCSDALSGWRGIALALTIPGALLVISGGIVTASTKAE